MPTSSPYPSIPIPTDDTRSMYQALLLMRQILTLLAVNIQSVTQQNLTQAAQIFSTKGKQDELVQNITLQTVNVASLQTEIDTLQAQVTGLLGNVAGLTASVSGLTASLVPLDNALNTQTVVQSGASLAINHSLGENCILALTASITSVSISNWPLAGTLGKILLSITNGGSFTISGWPSGTKWPGGVAPTITASGKDALMLFSEDGGVTIYGNIIGQGFA
jgi:hypothetical protein